MSAFRADYPNASFALGHNAWSDLTAGEYAARFRLGHENTRAHNVGATHVLQQPTAMALPDDIDWVAKGAVTPVKNQGRCGGCWSFSVTATIESAYNISGHPLTNFSEQLLLSCDTVKHGGTDDGCDGGDPAAAFSWQMYNPPCLASEYPFTGKANGTVSLCNMTCTQKSPPAIVTGHTSVAGEPGMYAALTLGPISVEIQANTPVFRFYKSGIIDSPLCGNMVDHAVTAVGFGTDADTGAKFWKIKNSWGTDWGEAGYVRIARDKNMCGIDHFISYPTVVGYDPVCSDVEYCSPHTKKCTRAAVPPTSCKDDADCAGRGEVMVCDPASKLCGSSANGKACSSPCTVQSQFCSPQLHRCLAPLGPEPAACDVRNATSCPYGTFCDPVTSACYRGDQSCIGP
jgi:hypothetical protein